MAEKASPSNRNSPPPQQQGHSDTDSDEIRALLRRDDLDGDDETEAAIASFIGPSLFYGNSGGVSGQQQAQQQQLLHPHSHIYSRENYSQVPPHQLRPALHPLPQSHTTSKPQRMSDHHSQMNDPFAALMSVSTAAAAMDSNAVTAGATVDVNNSIGMSDPMATAAALAAGDNMQVGVSTCAHYLQICMFRFGRVLSMSLFHMSILLELMN